MKNDSPQAQQNYQRRKCSKCNEDVGFSESDPCDRCGSEAQAPEALELKPIYVASRASIPERGQMWRKFRDEGVLITSSWIDEDGEGATGDFGELWLRITNEIRASAALVIYAEAADFPLKGALTEAGIALGMGKPVFICLPDLGILPRNYRPIGSWITHPLVTRCDLIKKAVWLASHTRADLPRAAADANAVYNAIESALNSYRMRHTREAPDFEHGLLLLDRLTPDDDKDVSRGREELDDLIDYVCGSVGDVFRATPRAQTGLTVEAALKELREMFPLKVQGNKQGRGIDVERNEFATSSLRGDRSHSKVNVRIEYAMGGYSAPLIIDATNVDEAMDQVRAWIKSRAEREGERT